MEWLGRSSSRSTSTSRPSTSTGSSKSNKSSGSKRKKISNAMKFDKNAWRLERGNGNAEQQFKDTGFIGIYPGYG
eukprot:IDg5647t1